MASPLPTDLWRRSARFLQDLMRARTQVLPARPANGDNAPAETGVTIHSAEASPSQQGHTVPFSNGANSLIDELLSSALILQEEWDALPSEVQALLQKSVDKQKALHCLVEHKLLTPYQSNRLAAGSTFGLVLGNYRVLDRLGAGGMGIVFKAEHVEMRRCVAIKVFPLTPDTDPRLLSRFLSEMRTVAKLNHPNIIAAIDSGKAAGPDAHSAGLRYFVMEYVPGRDLEDIVHEHGPLSVNRACDLIHQVASALAEVHKFHLVHRDIKPSNVLVTPEDQAKLLDFGLARHFTNRMTEPGMALGTIDYIAPEQARDASQVDIRADIYGLGGTLFWCLAGRVPFPAKGNIAEDLARRMTEPPPSIRSLRPEIPAELDAVVAKMMATDPKDRYTTPQALMRGLIPFLKPEAREHLIRNTDAATSDQRVSQTATTAGGTRIQRVLLVDDEASIRMFSRQVLQAANITCDEAVNGFLGVEAANSQPYDAILLDVDMPVLSGLEALKKLREQPPNPNLKIIMISGNSNADEMARLLVQAPMTT